MLKWTASAQKLTQLTPKVRSTLGTSVQPETEPRRHRRATIVNQDNFAYTSTPMVRRERNSPLVLTPLVGDILNMTPPSAAVVPLVRTPERRRPITTNEALGRTAPQRRHSTAGFLPTGTNTAYASTLPRFEEEYSPSTALPSGQELALRGLLPDPFFGNPRYFNTPELTKLQTCQRREAKRQSLPKKRKLESDFADIAQQYGEKRAITSNSTISSTESAGMGDQTLDKLIDAILNSARKDEKKSRSRKSFNLRRRTLLKNQAEQVHDLTLSPSYAAGEDPASDLSFLGVETVKQMPATPPPATPPPGTPLTAAMLQQLPTPTSYRKTALRSNVMDNSDITFRLETPVRKQKQHCPRMQSHEGGGKRYKVDACNCFDVGVGLPSIYV